ncbi:MAG: phosphohistidine phosphatase SixA [Ignavibacteriales bacterium]|nr:phosphohistidine phosphatase SixA [Ignavibacteriales bacterium]
MRLILLRHGDAQPAMYDAERTLSELGEEQANQAAQTLLRLKLNPEIIICSPLIRAQQTAEKIFKVFKNAEMETSEHLTPTSDHRHIIEILRRIKPDTVLLVGHEPHLSLLMSILTTGSRAGRFEISKCGIAVLESKDTMRNGNFALRLLIQSEQFRTL